MMREVRTLIDQALAIAIFVVAMVVYYFFWAWIILHLK